jgi:hypothetical protein
LAVPAQIAVLLALIANLFDSVPLEQMTAAGHAVREAATKIPAEVSARFETAAKLNDEDKNAIIEIARQALASFQPRPDTKPEVKVEPKAETKGDSKDKAETKSNEEVRPKPDPQVKAETKPRTESRPEPPAEVKPAETGPKVNP